MVGVRTIASILVAFRAHCPNFLIALNSFSQYDVNSSRSISLVLFSQCMRQLCCNSISQAHINELMLDFRVSNSQMVNYQLCLEFLIPPVSSQKSVVLTNIYLSIKNKFQSVTYNVLSRLIRLVRGSQPSSIKSSIKQVMSHFDLFFEAHEQNGLFSVDSFILYFRYTTCFMSDYYFSEFMKCCWVRRPRGVQFQSLRLSERSSQTADDLSSSSLQQSASNTSCGIYAIHHNNTVIRQKLSPHTHSAEATDTNTNSVIPLDP
jgi:hypothetical protein